MFVSETSLTEWNPFFFTIVLLLNEIPFIMKKAIVYFLACIIYINYTASAQAAAGKLAGYWSFDGNANDLSGNGNNGIVSGATLTSDRFGNAGHAYAFDGIGSKITIPNSPTIDMDDSQDFSVAFWIKTDPSNNAGIPISKNQYGSFSGYQFFTDLTDPGYCNSAGQISFYTASGGGEDACADSPVCDDYQNWYFITGVYHASANLTQIYVNGTLQSDAGRSAGSLSSLVDLTFGAHPSNQHFFSGALDEIRIYREALPDYQIQALYYAPGPGATPYNLTCAGVVGSPGNTTQAASCTQSSAAFLTKYGKQSFYVPTTNDPVITVKITFHIFNKADGTGCWPNTPGQISQSISELTLLGGWLGTGGPGGYPRFSDPRNANYSVPGFSPPFVFDSRVRYELTNIYFYNDDALNISTAAGSLFSAISAAGADRPNEGLPIIMNNAYLFGAAGYQSFYNGGPYIHSSACGPTAVWFFQQHFRHEIGHAMGWMHTYSPSCCPETADCNNPDFLSDVFPVNNPNCPGGNAGPCSICYEDPPLASNNVMANGSLDINWMSPLQMGRRIRNLHLGAVRKFAKDVVSDNANPWLITSNEDWDFDIQMYRDIIVKAPATLTIKCRVAMAITGKIVVEKGARLIIDGGEVTGWCKTGMWKGIEVEGTYGAGQLIYNPTGLAQDFGIVKVINNGTVSNAHNGITNARSDVNGNIMWGNQGGIIIGENGNFINNIRDVQFLAYQNPYGNDQSKFVKCNFKTTGALVTNAALITRVSLWEVSGVSFLGCNFEYAAGNTHPPLYRGNGIYSINARYSVDKVCNNNSNPCNSFTNSQFLNYTMGVWVDNTNPLKVVSVKNTNFIDIHGVSVYFNKVNYPVCESNYIKTPGDVNSWAGVYLNNCKYYNVKNNTLLQDYATVPDDVGIYATNSQSGAHQIYRNSFANFLLGIGAVSDNSGYSNYTDGLKMNCNDFTPSPNNFDIALLGNVPSVMFQQGKISQPLTPFDLVRNKYAAPSSCGTCENKWFIQDMQPTPNKPILHGSNLELYTQPVPQPAFSDPSVLVVSSNISLDYATHCPPNVITGGCTPPCLTPINIVLAGAVAQVNELAVSYNSLLDGGNTQNLLNAINSNMSNGDLRNLLLQYSPYLSDAVLTAYFGRSNLSPGHAQAVYSANAPVSATVWEAVSDLNLPNGIFNTVSTLQAQPDANPLHALQQQLNAAKFDLQVIVAEKLNYFLTDSMPSSQDSVIEILKNNPGLMQDADVQLVFAYMNKGDYTTAAQQVNSLGSSSDWAGLLNTLITLQSSAKNLMSVLEDPAAMHVIEYYAGTDGINGQGNAQALLKFVLNKDYFIPQPLPIVAAATGQLARSETASVQNVLSTNPVNVYPNPAQNGINIVFKEPNETAIAELRDLSGRLIYSVTINSTAVNYIPLNSVSAGMYLLSVTKNRQLIYQDKILKQD
jgi:hypothetical protein